MMIRTDSNNRLGDSPLRNETSKSLYADFRDDQFWRRFNPSALQSQVEL